MVQKSILLLIFIPLLSIILYPLETYSALTEEGIYRIEENAYYIGNNEVSAEEFLTSLRNIQCDGSGAKKLVSITTVIPVKDKKGGPIGRNQKATWRLMMPASMTIQQIQSDPNMPVQIYGHTTTCSP